MPRSPLPPIPVPMPTRTLLAAAGLTLGLGPAALAQWDPLNDPFPATLGLGELDGTIGFAARGIDPLHIAGRAVAGLGDVNGDGIDDVAIGDHHYGDGRPGRVHVVFGRAGGAPWPADFELSTLDGTNGFAIDGISRGDNAGYAVSAAGDINGDGVNDILVGAPNAEGGGPGGVHLAGRAFVVFGRDTTAGASFPSTIRLADLDGSTTGFAMEGVARNDGAGQSLAALGDINGDGVDDLAVGAPGADPGGHSYAGEVYVLFGIDTTTGTRFPPSVPLSSLTGVGGLRLEGSGTGDGAFVVAGADDLNGDGMPDLAIGASEAQTTPRGPGRVYVL